MKKAIALLSGGFDSPVAIVLFKDRLDIIAVHFHTPELTDGKEIEKVKKLIKQLQIQNLYLVRFTDVLKYLAENAQYKYYYIFSKIAMFSAAQIIARKENAQYLISGENLGQVSSQTLSNLVSIMKPIDLPILRPLLTYDKEEIVSVAKTIGTYELSQGPELCCLLGPKNPATKSEPQKIYDWWNQMEIEDLLCKAVLSAEVISL